MAAEQSLLHATGWAHCTAIMSAYVTGGQYQSCIPAARAGVWSAREVFVAKYVAPMPACSWAVGAALQALQQLRRHEYCVLTQLKRLPAAGRLSTQRTRLLALARQTACTASSAGRQMHRPWSAWQAMGQVSSLPHEQCESALRQVPKRAARCALLPACPSKPG